MLELSFPLAASHPGGSGSEYNEPLPLPFPAPRFAEEGNERPCLAGSGDILHKPDGGTRPAARR